MLLLARHARSAAITCSTSVSFQVKKMTRTAHAYVPGVKIFLLMVELNSQMGTRLNRPSKDTFFGQ